MASIDLTRFVLFSPCNYAAKKAHAAADASAVAVVADTGVSFYNQITSAKHHNMIKAAIFPLFILHQGLVSCTASS